jgi:hypothetical protein
MKEIVAYVAASHGTSERRACSNDSRRDKCLDLPWFETLAEARAIVEARRWNDHESRPHMVLGHKTPQDSQVQRGPCGSTTGSTAGEGQR